MKSRPGPSMLMALGLYICYQRQSVQEASRACDVAGKVLCLSISWPGVGVGAGDRCLVSIKFLTTLPLEASVSDQFRVHCVLEWNKVLILLSD